MTYGYEPKTPFDLDHHVYERNSPKYEAILRHRTIHQIYNLGRIREQAAKAIAQVQATQKKAIEKRILEESKELKPPFKLGDLVLLYRDSLSTSWSAKLQDKWDGPFIIHLSLGKGTYHIKSLDVQDTRIRRVHGNRLKPYLLPKVQWCLENVRDHDVRLDPETNHTNMTQENCPQDLPTSSSYPLQVPLSGSSAPSGIFLRSIFEEEGLAGVEAHLNNYLDKWEAENPQSVEYVTDTGVCAREGFVKYILNQMVENGFNMETLITATPFDANTGEDLISTEEIMGLLENDDWFDKIFENNDGREF
ncbi:hypothetical protein G6F30_012995 [Rhizopus arrhizus]|nr:hypothetical protein G6F30_012995 [Rhizopus arrhizus]